MIRPNLKKIIRGRSGAAIAVTLLACAMLAVFAGDALRTHASSSAMPIIGERLTYNVSFGKFDNVAFAELYTVSRGKLSGHDAIELRSKIKTFDMVGAAFYSINESRTTFASSETGYPLYASKIQYNSLEPKETVSNYLSAPTNTLDLLTLIAKVRDAGGNGSFSFSENDKVYTATFAAAGSEKVTTGIGDFDTVVSSVDSSFLIEQGITEMKINFTSDDEKIPVLFRFKMKNGVFRIVLASREVVDSGVEASPTPATAPTPVVVRTPIPIVSPTPYIDNQPLSPDMPFSLGETLEYSLSNAGRPIGRITLVAKERRMFAGQDSLLLAANVKSLMPGVNILGPNDSVTAQVNPDSLTPQQFEMRFSAGLTPFAQTERFDQINGTVIVGPGKSIDIPVGTHSLLSFLYAIRTMNLRPSRDVNNPVNDTRVAVFWDSRAYIFILRPSVSDLMGPDGKKTSTLLVSVSTGNPQLDQLAIKVWLSNDPQHLPLRISFGTYQADLV